MKLTAHDVKIVVCFRWGGGMMAGVLFLCLLCFGLLKYYQDSCS